MTAHVWVCTALAVPLASWWWPKRPARVPRPWTAGLLAGVGAALFGISVLVLKAGALGWDESLFRVLNGVPAALASVLTPLSHLFLPAGIVVVVVLTVGYVVARSRSIMPAAAGAVAAGAAWALANLAKAIADRPRPYEVVAGAVLRQQPAHGTSFPSSHTAVTVAVVIAPRAVPAPGAGRGGNRIRRPGGLRPGCTWACTTHSTSWAEQVSA